MARPRTPLCVLLALVCLASAPAVASDAGAAYARAEKLAAQGQYQEAITEYGAALNLYRKARDLAGAGRTLNRIARIHCDRGSFETARKVFAMAKGMLDRAADRAALAELYKNLGVLEDLTGHPTLAIEYAEKSLALYRELNDVLGQGHGMNNLGVIQESLGRYDAAIGLYRQAGEKYDQAGNRRYQAIALANIGKVHLVRGNYIKALEQTRAALAIARELELRPLMALMLGNLGAIYGRLGDDEQAVQQFEEALSLNEADGRLRESALNRRSLGQIHIRRREFDRAIEQYESARKTLAEIGERASLGAVEFSLGSTAILQSRWQAAEEHLTAALEIARELKQPEAEARAHMFLGQMRLRRGKFWAAVRPLRRALEIAETLQLPDSTVLSCEFLSYTYRKVGKLDSAIQMSKRAIAETEKLRGTIESDDLKAGLFSRFVGGYGRLTELYLEKHRRTQKRRYLNKAFEVLEQGRARSLLEMLARAGASITSGAPPELVEQEQLLERRRKDLSLKLKKSAPGADRVKLTKELKELGQEQNRLAAQIRQSHPDYAKIKYPEAASLKQVQAALADDEILLEYSFGVDQSRIWAIDRRWVTLHRFDGATVREAVPNYRDTLRDPLVRGLTRARRKLLEKQLYQQLIKPAAKRLVGKKRVLVAPQDELYALPFEALRRPDGSYLADHWTFLYTPSATLLVELARKPKQRTAERRPYLAFADPVFAPDDDPSKLPEGALRLERLPGTASEVRAAAQALGAEPESAVFLRERAQEAALKKLDLSSVRFLHFATHGLLGEEVDWLGQPALALDLAGSRDEDGLLTMEEVFNLRLDADAVLLSACNTGRGRQVRGEGVMGLTRAFFYAGTPVVVVSLWPVSDESTSKLISELSARLARGERVADALAGARRALRSTRKSDRWGRRYLPYDHPFYWAPFVVLGRD